MSISTVEIRAFSGPDLVELQGVNRPAIVRLNVGPKGDDGAAGSAATVSVGTTTTGNAGTNASVTNSGTSSAAVFNFTIPRGDTGAAGPNSVTSATSTNFTTGQVLYANGSVVGSLSRSGIDTRTTFPNDDVTAAATTATPDTIAKRDGDGSITVFKIITIPGGSVVLTDSNQNPLILTCSEMTDEQNISFPNESGIVTVQAVKSANFTAADGGTYAAVATLTVTDPTPSEGASFSVLVRNGTATVGGTAYSVAGTLIRRVYHSGAWMNYVYDDISGAVTLSNKTLNNTTTTGTLTLNGTTYTYGTGAASAHRRALTGDSIVTEAADFTLSEATHGSKFTRLTKTGSTQTITLPTSGVSTGAEFAFYRATSQSLAFSGGTVNGTANLASVPNPGAFGLKHLGSGTYDFI